MISIYGNPSADGKYFGLSSLNSSGGIVLDASDPANLAANGLGYSGVFPRDCMITSASVFAADPVADSINFVLRVDGVDSIVVVSLLAGEVFASKTRESYSARLGLIIPAGTLFAVRTDFIGMPTPSDFIFSMETYFV